MSYKDSTYYTTFMSSCLNCTACGLHKVRNGPPVIFRGNPRSKIMLIGEAPGKNEEKYGEPFIGRAGKYLEGWFEKYGLTSNMIYISNIVKCRPAMPKGSGKENRTPYQKERSTCLQKYLLPEIKHINPDIIIACGKTSAVGLGLMPTGAGLAGLTSSPQKKYIQGRERECWIMRHPAYALYSRGNPKKLGLIKREYSLLFTQIYNRIVTST